MGQAFRWSKYENESGAVFRGIIHDTFYELQQTEEFISYRCFRKNLEVTNERHSIMLQDYLGENSCTKLF